MEAESLILALEEEFKQHGEEFDKFLWSDKIGSMLESQRRFTKLVRWIENELRYMNLFAVLSAPMNRDKDYTKGDFLNYLEGIQRFGVLVHSKVLLEDERTSEEQRENIEYMLGQMFGVHYNELLEDYA